MCYSSKRVLADHGKTSEDRKWLANRSETVWLCRTARELPHYFGSGAISSRPVAGVMNLVSVRDYLRFSSSPAFYATLFVVTLADKRLNPAPHDFALVQNGLQAREPFLKHVPHWPEEGLTPSRHPYLAGARRIRVGYFGTPGNLDPAIVCAHDQDPLRRVAEFHMPEWGEFDDYGDIDVLISIRPPSTDSGTKPWSKFINAMYAGVPFVTNETLSLGEAARGCPALVEVSCLPSYVKAIRGLARDREWYRRSVEGAEETAQKYPLEWIRGQWQRALEEIEEHPRPSAVRLASRWVYRVLQGLRWSKAVRVP